MVRTCALVGVLGCATASSVAEPQAAVTFDLRIVATSDGREMQVTKHMTQAAVSQGQPLVLAFATMVPIDG